VAAAKLTTVGHHQQTCGSTHALDALQQVYKAFRSVFAKFRVPRGIQVPGKLGIFTMFREGNLPFSAKLLIMYTVPIFIMSCKSNHALNTDAGMKSRLSAV
jgi:hypothetical protein